MCSNEAVASSSATRFALGVSSKSGAPAVRMTTRNTSATVGCAVRPTAAASQEQEPGNERTGGRQPQADGQHPRRRKRRPDPRAVRAQLQDRVPVGGRKRAHDERLNRVRTLMRSVLESVRRLRPADRVAEDPSSPAEPEVEREEKEAAPAGTNVAAAVASTQSRPCGARRSWTRSRASATMTTRMSGIADDREPAQRVRIDDETGGYEAEQEPDQPHQHEQEAVHADVTLRASEARRLGDGVDASGIDAPVARATKGGMAAHYIR